MAQGEPQKPGCSLIPVLVVFGSGLGILVALVIFAGPAGFNIALAVGSVLAFAGLHYILWGWWLSDWIRRREESEQNGDR